MNVIFNLWFLASSVTVFALVQQAVQRRKHARAAMQAEGGLTRRDPAGGRSTAAAVGLVGVVRYLGWHSTTPRRRPARPIADHPGGRRGPGGDYVPADTTAQTTATGRRLCDRGCSYPGHCRRYQDNNGNGTCDLTEAIW